MACGVLRFWYALPTGPCFRVLHRTARRSCGRRPGVASCSGRHPLMRAFTHPARHELALAERPDPVAGDGQIVVQVRASALNRADLLQRAGHYPAPPGWPHDIPGLEYAGDVIATGTEETRYRVGDRVMGLVGGGAHAERLVVDELEAIAIPDGMSYTDAAAIPEAFLTAWDAITSRGRLAPGERILVHSVGSGVGTAAVQLARLLGGVAIGTSRSDDKLARATGLGMVAGVNTSAPQWEERVGGPVDVILDTLGAGAFHANVHLLAPRGRLVVIGTLSGRRAEVVELDLILRRRLEIIGTAMRIRSLSERVELAGRFGAEILPLIADGTLRPVVSAVLPFDAIEEAHQLMQSNRTFGKVVLTW
jgi:NADPH2:quinone reductase